MEVSMRSVIFGVDGLTFRTLHPLMERGDLPHFKKLSEEGCEAVLESKYPPLTPPAWSSLSTGLKPAKHGVYDFWMYDWSAEEGGARKVHINTRRKGGKALWNILSEYGKQVLVINVPATYPPEPVNGIMVSGYMTPSTDVDFTYPASFKEELFRVVPEYDLDLPTIEYERMKVSRKVAPLVDATLRMTERRIKLIMHMMREKPWDFCYLAFIGSDRIQHPIWREISALDTKATEYYRLLDDALGQVMDLLGPDDTLFVVSDHGFQGHSSYFDINEFLVSRGLLGLKGETLERRRKLGRANFIKQTANALNLRPVARKIKRSLKTAGLWKSEGQDINRPLFDDVDWEHTQAYVPSFAGFAGGYADIFLSPDHDPERIEELCDALRKQRDPKNGKPLIDAIYTTEVFGEGPYAPKEPHLLLLPTDGITFRVELGNGKFWDDLKDVFGSHQKDGVLYAYGGDFKRGFKAPNAEIYDLAPTLLRSMNLPFPHEFDGRVLDELFERKEGANQVATDEVGQTRRKLQKLLEV
jgi:predicted AlkP superfamily phosphohydrolase/phosphomutase